MITIINYDAGNLTSVARAVSHLGFECKVTNDIKEIERSQRIIFPGVGAAGSAMHSLTRLGLDKSIKAEFASGKPILGICLGTQIIMGYSDENNVSCLGIVKGSVRAFQTDIKSETGSRLKIPHMGWNRITIKRQHPVLRNVSAADEFYFVHGFYPDPDNATDVLATTDHGVSFAAVIGTKNIIATQFHPEKSGKPGLAILKNFCRWNPNEV